MKLRFDGRTWTGDVVDLRAAKANVVPETIFEAIRDGESDTDCRVVCPDSSPVYDHVGLVVPTIEFDRTGALAAAARSRGHRTPAADELGSVESRLADLNPEPIDLGEFRRRVADASGAESDLRERVASLRGRIRALRETGGDPATAETELAEVTGTLAEVETERIAAEQALETARKRARESRDSRHERLRLQDRVRNLRRQARSSLAERVRPGFEAALDGFSDSGSTAEALAVLHVADVRAPVVLACETRFRNPKSAANWLGAPVVRV